MGALCSTSKPQHDSAWLAKADMVSGAPEPSMAPPSSGLSAGQPIKLSQGGTVVTLTKGQPELDAKLREVPPTALVVLDFTASWCAPCQEVDVFMKRIAKQVPHALFVKADANLNQDLISSKRIVGFPTLVLYRDQKEIARFSRFVEAEMETTLKRLASDTATGPVAGK
mmetsp:Transcript_3418/g.8879  ORF Transcript_3418/g.8879 Transcript_3418/m.8879 type:complete len:169 (-) Transcript_3418:125-631(-)